MRFSFGILLFGTGVRMLRDWIFALFFSGFALTYLCSAGIERGLDLHGGSPASAGFFLPRVRDGFPNNRP